MILNPDMFKNIHKQNSDKSLTKQASQDNADTPKKPSYKFDSFSGISDRANKVGDAVNLMVRSSKKSCEKYRPPEI